MERRIFDPCLAERFKPGAPYRPANGTEGRAFDSMWCEGCTRDRIYRDSDGEEGDGCRIIADAMAYDIAHPDYPAAWVHGEDGQPKCLAFDDGSEVPRCTKTLDLFPLPHQDPSDD